MGLCASWRSTIPARFSARPRAVCELTLEGNSFVCSYFYLETHAKRGFARYEALHFPSFFFDFNRLREYFKNILHYQLVTDYPLLWASAHHGPPPWRPSK